MGFWDSLRTKSEKAFNRSTFDTSSDTKVVPSLTSLPPVIRKVSDTVGAQKLINDYIPNPDHRDKIGRVLTGLGKFAVESAVNESLKGVTGGIQVYKIVKEGLKDQSESPLQPTNGNQKAMPALVMEDMQANIEKLQKELNFLKMQAEASIQCADESDFSKEASTEPSEVLSSQKTTDAKKVFIRSRL